MATGGTVSLIYNGADLKWIIPHIYLITDPNKTVYTISPWLDIEIRLKISWENKKPELTMLELAKSFRKRGIKSIFFLSDQEKENKLNKRSMKLLREEDFEYTLIDKLHTKAIIGERLAYFGSANITFSGLNINNEAVTLERVTSQSEIIDQTIGGQIL